MYHGLIISDFWFWWTHGWKSGLTGVSVKEIVFQGTTKVVSQIQHKYNANTQIHSAMQTFYMNRNQIWLECPIKEISFEGTQVVLQKHKYTNTQIHRYTYTQIHRYTIYKYTVPCIHYTWIEIRSTWSAPSKRLHLKAVPQIHKYTIHTHTVLCIHYAWIDLIGVAHQRDFITRHKKSEVQLVANKSVSPIDLVSFLFPQQILFDTDDQ